MRSTRHASTTTNSPGTASAAVEHADGLESLTDGFNLLQLAPQAMVLLAERGGTRRRGLIPSRLRRTLGPDSILRNIRLQPRGHVQTRGHVRRQQCDDLGQHLIDFGAPSRKHRFY